MALIVYLDETGDHTLELVDKEFPLFALVMLICDVDVYTQQIVPAFYKLKFDYFGHEDVIIHSRDIRKAQGEFGFLTRSEVRQPFYTRINDIMGQMSYSLIASVIHKEKHKDRYGIWADNPYDLALKFAMERLLPLVESMEQREVRLIAEARGKREDAELALSFTRLVTQGTEYISS